MTATTIEPKHIVRSFYESYNAKDLDASFATYISPALINHAMGGAYDADGWRDLDKTILPAFSDFTYTVLAQIAEGDMVATRWRFGGTHAGVFMGMEPKGNVAFLTGTSFDRVADGVIVEHWSDLDFGGFMQQLAA